MKTLEQLQAEAFLTYDADTYSILDELQKKTIDTQEAVRKLLENRQTRWAAAVRVVAGERDAVLEEAEKAVQENQVEEAYMLYKIADAPMEKFKTLGDIALQQVPADTYTYARLTALCYSESDAESNLVAFINSLMANDENIILAAELCREFVCPNKTDDGRKLTMMCAQKAAENHYTGIVQDLYFWMRGDTEFEQRFKDLLPPKKEGQDS